MKDKIRTQDVLEAKLKTFFLSIICLGLIVGSLFIFRKPFSVASYSSDKSLEISDKVSAENVPTISDADTTISTDFEESDSEEAEGEFLDEIVTLTYSSESETLDSPKTPAIEIDTHGYLLGSWTNQPVTLTARNSVESIGPVSIYYREQGSEEWLDYQNILTIIGDTDSKVFEFKAVSKTGLESDIETAEIKKDSIAPTGEIKSYDSSLNQFLNTITFGLFFNETKTFDVSALDDRSGINSVEYLISNDKLSVDELKASTNWTPTDGSVSVEPEKPINVYFRLTDYSGNVAVLNESGVIFELSGLNTVDIALENNHPEGYMTIITNSGSITILSDLEYVTEDDSEALNASEAKLREFLENSTDASTSVISNLLSDFQKAIAKVKETEQKILVIKESYSVIPPLDSINSGHRKTVEALISAIEETEAENGNHLTAEEKIELNAMVDDLAQKLMVISEIEEKLKIFDEALNKFSLETVTKDNLKTLAKLSKEIEKLKNSLNLTSEEREHLNELLSKVMLFENRINEAKTALSAVHEEATSVAQITPDNVILENQTALETMASAYAEVLDTFGSNFSSTELLDVNEKITTIDSSLEVIKQVSEFKDLLSRLPSPEKITYASRTLIKSAEDAHDALSNHGRVLAGLDSLAKYRTTVEAYRAYIEASPFLYAFETLDIFWWGTTTLVIIAIFVFITRRTHHRYTESIEDYNEL